jgi:hypothetical protein
LTFLCNCIFCLLGALGEDWLLCDLIKIYNKTEINQWDVHGLCDQVILEFNWLAIYSDIMASLVWIQAIS